MLIPITSGLGYAFANAEAAAWVAAMTTPPSDAHQAAYDAFVGAWKAAGVWAKTDFVSVFAAHTEQAAQLNGKNPGTFDFTKVNSPAFAAGQGYTGNATGYLKNGYIPSANLAQNSACTMGWSRTVGASAGSTATISGSQTGSSGLRLTMRQVGDTVFMRANDLTSGPAPNTTTHGWFAASRTGASTNSVMIGDTITNQSFASNSPSTVEFYACGYNSAGSLAAGALQVSFVAVSDGLSDGELAAAKAATVSLLTALGAI